MHPFAPEHGRSRAAGRRPCVRGDLSGWLRLCLGPQRLEPTWAGRDMPPRLTCPSSSTQCESRASRPYFAQEQAHCPSDAASSACTAACWQGHRQQSAGKLVEAGLWARPHTQGYANNTSVPHYYCTQRSSRLSCMLNAEQCQNEARRVGFVGCACGVRVYHAAFAHSSVSVSAA